MNAVRYGDLKRARSSVLKQAKIAQSGKPGHIGKGSLDTTTPMVQSGLEVVQFSVGDATLFAREITNRNLHRISVAKGSYAVNLYAAGMLSGMVYGAEAERRRHGWHH